MAERLDPDVAEALDDPDRPPWDRCSLIADRFRPSSLCSDFDRSFSAVKVCSDSFCHPPSYSSRSSAAAASPCQTLKLSQYILRARAKWSQSRFALSRCDRLLADASKKSSGSSRAVSF